MSEFNPAAEYGYVRGFNFQPDWSTNGCGVWLKFAGDRYRKLIARGKELFPRLNTLRIWLSFDAWCEDRQKYLENVRAAAKIIRQEKLKFIPVYFNGWFGIPVFGGFVPEHLDWAKKTNGYANFILYLKESLEAVSSDAILLHDVCNEPFNNSWRDRERTEIVLDFLSEMCRRIKKADSRPITIGSQGIQSVGTMDFPQIKSKWKDIDLLSEMIDVITLHPYIIDIEKSREHFERLKDALEYLRQIKKPVIITECCWAGKTDDERKVYLETELSHYSELGIGFLAHALSESPVADLHRLDDEAALSGSDLYMAFIDREGKMRKWHDIFNNY